MICEKCLRSEFKNADRYIRQALKSDVASDITQAVYYKQFLEFVLSDDDCRKYKRGK